ncbi:PqqD family protein [Paenibacillus sp. SI8]|uniref:PqqD family protein n=1 Tax=unclassified Paenibacillus TaxID=185978 RepID=UPI003465BA63
MKVYLNKDVIVHEEDEEIILVNMARNKFYSLDKMGTVIWKLIVESNEISKVIDKISNEFEVDRHIIETDLDELLNDLMKAEVITTSV